MILKICFSKKIVNLVYGISYLLKICYYKFVEKSNKNLKRQKTVPKRNTYVKTKVKAMTIMRKFLKVIQQNTKFYAAFSLVVILEVCICLKIYSIENIHGETIFVASTTENTGTSTCEDKPMPTITIACAGIFIILDTIFLFLWKVQRFHFQKRENALLKNYSERLESLYGELRGFKHDYINILSTLSVYIKEQKYMELQEYFDETILPQGKNLIQEDIAIAGLSNMKIEEIKGLIYSKLLKALEENLNITLDLKDSITEMDINTSDLIRILGIFLDNAIEASKETEEKYLYLGLLQTEECTYIRVENSVNHHSPQMVEQIYQNGFSTKGKNRGIGLANVEKILLSYPRILHDTEQTDKKFVQQLKILKHI